MTGGNEGGVSMRLVAADGVKLRGNTIQGSIGGFASIELDAASDNNLILRNEIGPGVFDAGTGNCWRGNTGPDVPTTCP